MSYTIIEREVEGGFDLDISTHNGYVINDGQTQVTLHLRTDSGPRKGERVVVDGRLIKVLSKKHDASGRLLLMDEDTGAWHVWPGGDGR